MKNEDSISLLFNIVLGSKPAAGFKAAGSIDNRMIPLLKRLKLLVPAYLWLKKWGLLRQLPEDIVALLQEEHHIASIRARIQWRDAREICTAFRQEGIHSLLIKGTSTQWRYYEDPAVRCGKDVDLLINKSDIPKAKQTMKTIGFVQAALAADGNFVNASEELIQETESKHYELAFYTRRNRLVNLPEKDMALLEKSQGFTRNDNAIYTYSVIDIHWTPHFLFDVGELFRTSIVKEIQNVPFGFLSPEWELIYIAFKMYFESFDHYGGGIHFYSDIVHILKSQKTLDWAYHDEKIKQFGLEACNYYVFKHLLQAGITLPKQLKEGIHRWQSAGVDTKTPRECMDFGDFLPFAAGMRL